MVRLWVLASIALLTTADTCQWKASETLTALKMFSCANITTVLERFDINAPMVQSPSGDEFRVYVFDNKNRDKFETGQPYVCLNDNCGSNLSMFDAAITVSGDVSIAIVCVEFPCNVSWNWQMARELSSGHRLLAGYNGCVASYPNIQTGLSDTYLSFICSAKAGSTFGPVNNGYAMVLSTNNDKYRVLLFDWTNYQKYLASDSTQQCVSGSNCVILDGKLKQTYNTPVSLSISQTYVAVVECQNSAWYCSFTLSFQFTDPNGKVNAAGPYAVTSSNPQPWEYTNACSSPYSTISTTSQYQMIAFICSAQAGATFGRSANSRTMIDSSQYDKFQVFLYDWTSYQNWNLGLSATCKNSGCNNIIDTGIGPGYDTSVTIPTTDTYVVVVVCKNSGSPSTCKLNFNFNIAIVSGSPSTTTLAPTTLAPTTLAPTTPAPTVQSATSPNGCTAISNMNTCINVGCCTWCGSTCYEATSVNCNTCTAGSCIYTYQSSCRQSTTSPPVVTPAPTPAYTTSAPTTSAPTTSAPTPTETRSTAATLGNSIAIAFLAYFLL
ncbi:hypothetical protein AC1031_011140 [Aphanomyces cochlioides]|nr:hypothetical protein AC1031_011140 [Aphanomyces cochlioides]